MKKTSKNIQDIDAYLDGYLSQEEAAAFERQLSVDKQLTQEVRWQLDLRDGIHVYEANRVKAVLQRIESPWLGLQMKQKKRRWMSAAAVLLIIVGNYLIIRHQPVYYDFLANQYFETYPNLIQPLARSDERPPANLLTLGMQAYDQQQYHQAIQALSECKEDGRLSISFYLGMCYYQTGQLHLALREFRLMKKHEESSYYDAAIWYQTLTYLKLGNIRKAEGNLLLLLKEQNVYSEKAARLQFWL